MRPRSQYNAAMYLLQIGLNDCQIGRIMGISRGTIRDWRSNGDTPVSSVPLDDGGSAATIPQAQEP